MAGFVAFIKGPMVWVAFIVFFGGLIVQGIRFFALTRKKDPAFLPEVKKNKKKKTSKKALGKGTAKAKRKTFMQRLDPLIRFAEKRYDNLRDSMFWSHPVMACVSVLFHVFLFATPIFLFAHNELFRRAWGFSLPSLSESTTDMMTILFLLCGFFFLSRRIFVRRVRAITAANDYLMLLVTVTPFLTGFLAFRHWFDYPTTLIVHILSGELMLMLIPFSKLGHMIYLFLYRLFIGGEYSFGQGRRAW